MSSSITRERIEMRVDNKTKRLAERAAAKRLDKESWFFTNLRT